MMVTFVSQCQKKALNKTRRVLDAFANRIGDNTWQTVITQEGLLAVKKLLRKTASKNTGVSCFWIRSRSRSELVWVVGNRNKFDSEGRVPVNTTKRNLINADYENDWQYLPLIKALCSVAALLHDWGKATRLFQEKLDPKNKQAYKGDPIRHEWISCLLLNALVQSKDNQTDDGWLDSLINGDFNEGKLVEFVAQREVKPLYLLPPAAKLVAWLIVSHHRLPVPSTDYKVLQKEWSGVESPSIDVILKRIEQSWGYQNRQDEQEYLKRVSDCFEFPQGLLSQSPRWMVQAKKWAQRLRDCDVAIKNVMSSGSYRLILHHARLCLMLGDHFYSSQDADAKWKNTTGLFANTDRKTREFKQHLDEHLFGVAKNALRTAHLLPVFEKQPPMASDIVSLKKLSPAAFRWQDKAVAAITTWKKQKSKNQHGFFAVNMASTGCGKTFANAKVVRALSDDGQSLRYILALGLRTLTLQTGDEYRDRIGLENDELAVLIGSKAVTELHKKGKAEQKEADSSLTGSESEQPLLDEYIDYDGNVPEEGLTTVLTCDKDRQFLYAPVLACTIDHLMAATETRRGGRYILPCLRLMSSDLVIDEVDDFTGSDLIAIGRLIHLAGMLGRKVMISSATIPPDLAEGYFHAYKTGWRLHSQCHDASNDIACAWIDEFRTDITSFNCDIGGEENTSYQIQHRSFINRRVAKLAKQNAKRKAEIIECRDFMEDLEFDEDEAKQSQYFAIIQQAIFEKHLHHHTVDKKTGIAVSFGVVRVANILPCVSLTKYLLQADSPDGFEIKAMAYHSQQVLLLRHEQEKHLDEVLKRKESAGEQPVAFNNEVIRGHLDRSTAKNILFVLVATPVEEVGRDHDFDWAVIEPSSYRSIIQLAGRVHRHRHSDVIEPNIALMQYNWKAFKGGDEKQVKYFNRPGYEEKVIMETHDLKQLIDTDAVAERLDAVPRILKKEHPNYRQSLADLEHYVTHSQLTNYQRLGPDTMQGYLIENWYLTALPQYMNPFRKSEASTNLFLTYTEELDGCCFSEKDEKGYAIRWEGNLDTNFSDSGKEECQSLWLNRDYKSLLAEYVDEYYLTSKRRVSLRYGELSIVLRDGAEYEYSDQFGLVKI